MPTADWRALYERHKRLLPILLVHAVLVLYGIWMVRPHLMVVDAHWAVLWALRRAAERQLFIPAFQKGGNLHIHLLTLSFVPTFLYLVVTGQWDPEAIASARSLAEQSPSIYDVWGLPEAFLDIYYQFFITGRLLSALAALLTVILVYLIATRTHDQWAGLVAAAVTSVSMVFVDSAHFATEDVVMTFFIVLTFFFLAEYTRAPRFQPVALAAVAMGLATSAKALAALLVFPLVYAYLRTTGVDFRAFPGLVKLGLLSLGAWLLTTLSILVYPREFVADLFGIEVPYLVGQYTGQATELVHPGWVVHFFNLMRGFGLPLFLLILAAVAVTGYRHLHHRDGTVDSLVLVFVVVYFLLFGALNVNGIHYAIPLVPLLALLAAPTITEALTAERTRSIARPAVALVLIFSLVYTGVTLVQFTGDSRLDSAEWLADNLDAGSEVDVYTHVMNRPVLPEDATVNNLNETDWTIRTARLDRGEPDYVILVSNQYLNCFQYRTTDCREFYRPLLQDDHPNYEIVAQFGPSIRLQFGYSDFVVDSVAPRAVRPVNPTVVVLERRGSNA